MNGDSTEPWANNNSPPNITINSKIGASHSFFLTLKKDNSSLRKLMALIQLSQQLRVAHYEAHLGKYIS